MSRNTGTNNMASPEDRKKYLEAWSNMMIDIWKEKVERLQVWDTWNLHRSIMNSPIILGGNNLDYACIMHSFVEYGVYQDMGVGNGFRRGNSGDLGFTPTRQPRPWLSPKFFSSVMNLKDHVAEMYGEEFCGIMMNVLESK